MRSILLGAVQRFRARPSLGRSFALALSFAPMVIPGRAEAACTPLSPVNNTTVTCTGATVNANGTNGYGTNTDTGNVYNVLGGASVTGSDNGITFIRGTVNNSGSITATNVAGDGILSTDSVTVANNAGATISGTDGIKAFNNVTLNNAGVVSGGTFGVEIGNSHTVGDGKILNSGSITGGNIGITGDNVMVNNAGAVAGASQASASAMRS
jgi:hypothetical protein